MNGTCIFQNSVIPQGNGLLLMFNEGLSPIKKLFQVVGFLMSQLVSKGDVFPQAILKNLEFWALVGAFHFYDYFCKVVDIRYKIYFISLEIPLRAAIVVSCLFHGVKRLVKFSHNPVHESTLPSGINLN